MYTQAMTQLLVRGIIYDMASNTVSLLVCFSLQEARRKYDLCALYFIVDKRHVLRSGTWRYTELPPRYVICICKQYLHIFASRMSLWRSFRGRRADLRVSPIFYDCLSHSAKSIRAVPTAFGHVSVMIKS